jgi:pimeloyl-ACP methyl ester carboxylesterase
MFNPSLTAFLPLGDHEKLGSSEFPIPVSFFYGDEDWVKNVDEDAAQLCILKLKKKHGIQSNYYAVPQAGHNMHMDNPDEFCRLIIMDINTPEEENWNPEMDY